MKHIKDIAYKGHEIVLMKDDSGYAIDIRSNDFDGEFIIGYTAMETAVEAMDKAKEFIDRRRITKNDR